jgi:pimeloyl-ACP methyl ester carboxylesterase
MIMRPKEVKLVKIADTILRIWNGLKKKEYDFTVLVGHSFGGLIAL